MSMLPGPAAVVPPTEQLREATADEFEIAKMTRAAEEKHGHHPHGGVRQRLWGLQARLDPTVTLEEYVYWAGVEREMEEEEHRRYVPPAFSVQRIVKGLFKKDPYEDDKDVNSLPPSPTNGGESSFDEKTGAEKGERAIGGNVQPIAPAASKTHDYDAEWRTAARALRSATWGGIFYLITTDILGWGQTPYVFANTGYGLGVGIFVLMGLAAGFSGWMIWRVFLKLDSSRYPVLSYGDPYFRLYGPKSRHFINILQAIQMFLSVCVVQLGQTGIIAQLGGSANLCYIVCAVIALVVGIASGYLRALRHLGWLCNFAVWLNIISFIIICVAAAKYGPDVYPQVQNGILPKAWLTNPEPVRTFIDAPPPLYQPTDSNLFAAKFNGINSMVYAYSGALFFVAFMAEMRHPLDFWKAVFLAQLFISVVYIFFGAFTYTYYGQYSYSVINQVVKPLRLQVVSNVLSLLTGWLAIFLYFNIGMKTVYLEIGQEIFNLPPITTNKGKYLWWVLGPVYWILAFVVSMSVPEFNAFTNFVGGLFSLNFTYSFSGIMFLALKTQLGAALPGEGFDPATGQTTRHDAGYKRLVRGYFKSWKWTVPVTIFTGCGLAASGMGTWAAILALESAFGPSGSAVTSWTCKNPYYTDGTQ